MLSLESVSIKIGDKLIIDNISFNASKSQFISLIGPNGSGKSTLIKSISKMLPIEKGKILVADKNIYDYKSRDFAQILSTMTQHGKAIEEISVYDMVSYGRVPYKNLFSSLTQKDSEIVMQALRVTDLLEYKDRKIGSLSGGEFQRVYLASCLAQEPKVLILDEPTNHLDIKHQYKILSLVRKYAKENNLTIICVLHDINQAIKYSDKMIIVKNGEIKYTGNPKDIINDEVIKEVYEINVKVHYDEHGMHLDFLDDI